MYRDKQKSDSNKLLLVSALVIIPLLFLGYFGFNRVMQYFDSNYYNKFQIEEYKQELVLKNQLPIKNEKYLHNLQEGDKWIEQKHWGNAIYYYTNATELFPEDFDANYRLVLAYSNNCKYNNLYCRQGNKLNLRLLKYFPKNHKLVTLKNIFELKKVGN